jgi:glycosyltransferase involved in cell wall biosynthesis
MRILLSAYSSDSRRGSESLVGYHYARILSERHEVSMITCAPTTVDFVKRIEALDLGARELNEVGRRDLMTFELAQFPRARRIVREERIDLIHRATPVSTKDPTALCYLRPRFLIGPLLVSGTPPLSFRPYMWRQIAEYRRRTPWYCRWRPIDRFAGLTLGTILKKQDHFRKAEAILVGTSHTIDALPAPWRRKCVVVPHIAVETEKFLPRIVEKDRPVILYAGRLTGHKGLELMLRALASIKDTVDFQARIIGRGTPFYESFLRNLTHELGMTERVAFIPPIPRDDLLAEIQACDVFCFPSISDTYGVALLEAMSCERACVVADTGGPHDIVKEETGIKIPLNSPEQYVHDYGSAVMKLLQEPALRQDMGGRARELIISRNRWEVVRKILLDTYEEIERRL